MGYRYLLKKPMLVLFLIIWHELKSATESFPCIVIFEFVHSQCKKAQKGANVEQNCFSIRDLDPIA
jgi:hypothetical protein